MARPSSEAALTKAVRQYLHDAEARFPEAVPLDVKSVAAAMNVSRTTLYEYELDEEIKTVRNRLAARKPLTGAALERARQQQENRELRAELERIQAQNRCLLRDSPWWNPTQSRWISIQRNSSSRFSHHRVTYPMRVDARR